VREKGGGGGRGGEGLENAIARIVQSFARAVLLSFARVLSVPANASLFLCATASHSRCGGLDSIAVVWKTKKRKETETIENTVV
jgi:hypothetical protein